MFTLTLDRAKYFRVRKGVSAAEIRSAFSCPVPDGVSAGEIIALSDCPLEVYTVRVGDNYAALAKKFGVDESQLRALNGDAPLYPTRRIFIRVEERQG